MNVINKKQNKAFIIGQPTSAASHCKVVNLNDVWFFSLFRAKPLYVLPCPFCLRSRIVVGCACSSGVVRLCSFVFVFEVQDGPYSTRYGVIQRI